MTNYLIGKNFADLLDIKNAHPEDENALSQMQLGSLDFTQGGLDFRQVGLEFRSAKCLSELGRFSIDMLIRQ